MREIILRTTRFKTGQNQMSPYTGLASSLPVTCNGNYQTEGLT